MNNSASTNVPARRFRFSLLTVLFLFALIACGITIWQLWREIGPQRQQLQQLRNEVGYLTIDDPKQFHAIEVLTNKDYSWRWRIWVPEGQLVSARCAVGNVPRRGFPDKPRSINLEAGEHWITLELQHNPIDDSWTYVFATPAARTVNTEIDKDQLWMNWGRSQEGGEGIGFTTATFPHDDSTYLLKRYRVSRFEDPNPNLIDAPTPGFIIWLEQR
jgi:hypothetical protein